jgi:hypothetical protein
MAAAKRVDNELVAMMLKTARLKEDRSRPESINMVPEREDKTKADTSAVVPLNRDAKLRAYVPLSPDEKFDQAQPDRGFQDRDIKAVENFMKKKHDSIK